jgi:Protein of unknown function (DUF2384)
MRIVVLERNRLIPEVHTGNNNRIDAKRVAQLLGLSSRELAEILGITERGLNKNPTSTNIQDTLGKMVGMVSSLRAELGGNLDFVQMWFRTGNPMLAGHTPLEALKQGKLEVVLRLVHRLEAGDSL